MTQQDENRLDAAELLRINSELRKEIARHKCSQEALRRTIAATRRSEEALARFRAAMDATADAICLVDHAGMALMDVNAAACRLVGYSREEMLRLPLSELGLAPPEQLKPLLDGLISGSARAMVEVSVRRRDGSEILVEMQRQAVRSDSGWIIVVVARDITERKRTAAALRQSQNALRRLAAYQETIKEAERVRIAREIHDELGGLLTGIKANVSVSMDRAVAAGLPADPLLADACTLVDNAIETVRRVIADLRPSVLDQLGVWAALDWYAGQIQVRTGLTCHCRISKRTASIRLDPERSTMLFRVVQEALTNVVRHAAASQVSICAVRKDQAIVVEIRDDGKGIDVQRLLDGDARGILGMHERTRHFGGTLRIHGAPGQGTVIELRLPY
ncbi:MAG: PAS domain-containing sensor histidine kinase [Noviherbaspirillum sp.]